MSNIRRLDLLRWHKANLSLLSVPQKATFHFNTCSLQLASCSPCQMNAFIAQAAVCSCSCSCLSRAPKEPHWFDKWPHFVKSFEAISLLRTHSTATGDEFEWQWQWERKLFVSSKGWNSLGWLMSWGTWGLSFTAGISTNHFSIDNKYGLYLLNLIYISYWTKLGYLRCFVGFSFNVGNLLMATWH